MIDNDFTNGSNPVKPFDPYCSTYHACGRPMSYIAWNEATAVAMLSGNTIDGKPASSADLLPCYDNVPKEKTKNPTCAGQSNIAKRDLLSTSGSMAPSPTGLTAQRFVWNPSIFIVRGLLCTESGLFLKPLPEVQLAGPNLADRRAGPRLHRH